MKKWFVKLVCCMLICCMFVCLTACSDKDTKKDDKNETTPAAETGTPAAETGTPIVEATETPKTLEEQMIAKSLVSTGNNYRFKKVIEKAQAGEDVTIAFLGGSITEGYNAGTKEIYAKLVYDYIAKNYGTGENVHYVNAGLSGTPSILGLIRSDRDIFAYEPDLLFIEFAVNDGTSQIDSTGLESLIVKALNQANEPEVILLYSVTSEGYTCQDNMNAIAFCYDIPRVSVKTAIWESIENGEFTWAEWSNDEAHPNEGGQLLYSKFIINLMETMLAEETDEAPVVPTDFVKGFDHTALKMVDRSMNMDIISLTSLGSFAEKGDLASFNQGWKNETGNTSRETFTFTFTGSAFYVVYKDTASEAYGTAEVYVDGEYVMSLYANTPDGWGNPVTERILRTNDSAEHTVEIRMKEGEESKQFAILALGIVP